MMVYLEGNVVHQGDQYIIVVQQGIGYRVSVTDAMARAYQGQVTLYTHEVIRDNERELFGFSSLEALELFWKLIGISGVGPRGAQKIVTSDVVSEVKAKIMSGDVASLTSVPGVGKKTAQKIILELKGVLADEPSVGVFDQDALDALVGLGYSKRDAQTMLSGIEAESTEERIRIALKGGGL